MEDNGLWIVAVFQGRFIVLFPPAIQQLKVLDGQIFLHKKLGIIL